jgi:hypothetical protein
VNKEKCVRSPIQFPRINHRYTPSANRASIHAITAFVVITNTKRNTAKSGARINATKHDIKKTVAMDP